MDQRTPHTPGHERRARLDERTLAFVDALDQSGAIPDGVYAAEAACAVFDLLTQRVSGGQAGDFAGSLPQPLGTMLFERVAAREESPDLFDRDEFLERVGRKLGIGRESAERLARAVFAAMNAHLPTQEVDDVGNQLPPDLEELWRHPEQ